MADVFSTDRKAAQARAIGNAVTEITVGLSRSKEAIRIYNAARVDDANLAEKGVREASDRAANKVLCNVCKEKGQTDGVCAKCATLNAERPAPVTMSEDLVTGWAHFADEWRQALDRMGSFIGEDVDELLASFTKRIREWQTKMRPFMAITVEVMPYDVTNRPTSKVTIAAGVVGALLALYFGYRVAGAASNVMRQIQGMRAQREAMPPAEKTNTKALAIREV